MRNCRRYLENTLLFKSSMGFCVLQTHTHTHAIWNTESVFASLLIITTTFVPNMYWQHDSMKSIYCLSTFKGACSRHTGKVVWHRRGDSQLDVLSTSSRLVSFEIRDKSKIVQAPLHSNSWIAHSMRVCASPMFPVKGVSATVSQNLSVQLILCQKHGRFASHT